MVDPPAARPRTAAAPQVWSFSRAVVAFEDRSGPSLLRLLARGFRHCFCVLGDGERWTLLDPLKTRLHLLSFTGCSEAELVRHLAQDGRRLLLGRPDLAASLRPASWRPLTCVEIVKRVLDLDAPGVLTPRQLHAVLIHKFGFVVPTTSSFAESESPKRSLTFTYYRNNILYKVNPPPSVVRTGVLDDGADAGSDPQGISSAASASVPSSPMPAATPKRCSTAPPRTRSSSSPRACSPS